MKLRLYVLRLPDLSSHPACFPSSKVTEVTVTKVAIGICQSTSARKIVIARVSVSRIIVWNARVFKAGRVIVREARVLSLFRKVLLRLGMSVLGARAASMHNARLPRRGTFVQWAIEITFVLWAIADVAFCET